MRCPIRLLIIYGFCCLYSKGNVKDKCSICGYKGQHAEKCWVTYQDTGVELNSQMIEEWILDTCAVDHMTPVFSTQPLASNSSLFYNDELLSIAYPNIDSLSSSNPSNASSLSSGDDSQSPNIHNTPPVSSRAAFPNVLFFSENKIIMEDSTAKTIDFLRARLLAERSVSRTAKQRAYELAKRVTELEKQLKFVSLQRKKAEKATENVLAILENHGRTDLSDLVDSSSDQEEISSDFKDDKHEETEGFSGSEVESSSVNGKSLSWRSSKNSSSRFLDKKYTDASRRRRNSFTSTGSSQRCAGKSCRQIRQRDHSSRADVSPNDDATNGHHENEGRTTSEGVQNSADMATETSLEESNTCNGHAVQNRGTEKEMEKALKHQAQFIARYEEEEKAQREWEDKFRENNGSTPENSWDPGTHSDVTEEIHETKAPGPPSLPPGATEKLTLGSQQIDHGVVDANLSENLKTDTELVPGHNMKSEPLDTQNQPQDLQGTPTNFSQSQVSSSLVKSNEPGLETPENPVQLGSVLEALQQAKLSLRQNLDRFPLLDNGPAVPSFRPGDKFPVPFSSAGLFRLPTDYEYEEKTTRAKSLTYDPRLSLTNYPTDDPSGRRFISSPFRESFSRSASSLDDRFHMVPTFPYQETVPEIPRLPSSALNPRLDTSMGLPIDPRLGVGPSAYDPRLGVVQTALDSRLSVGQSAFDPRTEPGPLFMGDRRLKSSARIPPSSRYGTLPGGDIQLQNRSLYDDYMRSNTYK
ncbi:hypothetical protein L1987_23728 [Smallanthus sonchifolius]|uniref:Uncharacterized protein n=1 Tax=Smallanthus sonchifolius TaxID=185202 RepID=A0ACB9IIF8_9ASTR|nr:hypothetical protein L1987_23728 [Smallanthus sonchifolius]